MTRIDIFSGFLGAGKTTLIRKLIAEGYQNEKLVLIENEFGEIAIDGGFLQDAGVQITEMNSGCICCTLVGDFTKALKKVMDDYAPDRILIEPSGVGKLSDVARAVERVEGAHIGAKVTVVDAGKAKMYARNFGEFFNDQVANADLIVMSRTDTAKPEKTLEATEILKALNPEAGLITTPWAQLSGEQIREAMDKNGLKHELEEMEHEHHHHHHDHDEDECDDPECECHHHHHHHDHDEDETSTSIITTITITRTARSATIRSASATITTMMTTMTTTTSTTIITITTPTRSSRAGAWRRPRSSPRKSCAIPSASLTTRPASAPCCARRASWTPPTASGSTLTTCPARSTFAAARLP